MSVLVTWREPLRRARVTRLIRYGAVSAIATTTSLVVLGVLGGLVGAFDAPAAWSNVLATAIGTVPSFELNRRWVWGKRGRVRLPLGAAVPAARPGAVPARGSRALAGRPALGFAPPPE